MSVMAVVGAQWGDEGKGKIVDELAPARTTSSATRVAAMPDIGSSAATGVHLSSRPGGHPASSASRCIIGNGVVIDPSALLDEMDKLQRLGVDLSRLHQRARARRHALPLRARPAGGGEPRAGQDRHDACAASAPPTWIRYSRTGIRMADLLDVDHFRAQAGRRAGAEEPHDHADLRAGAALARRDPHRVLGYAQRLRPQSPTPSRCSRRRWWMAARSCWRAPRAR